MEAGWLRAQSGVLIAVLLAACVATPPVAAGRVTGRLLQSITDTAKDVIGDAFGSSERVSVTKGSSNLLTQNLKQLQKSNSKTGTLSALRDGAVTPAQRSAPSQRIPAGGGAVDQPDAMVLTVAPDDVGSGSGSGGSGGGGGGGSGGPLTDRVIFDPFGDDDYVIQLFGGIVDVAEAQPAIAAAGAAVSHASGQLHGSGMSLTRATPLPAILLC